MYESTLLTWTAFTCADVHALIRDAFDEWQHNSMISFLEVDSSHGATVTIRAEALSHPNTIAQAAHGVITMDEAQCRIRTGTFVGPSRITYSLYGLWSA